MTSKVCYLGRTRRFALFSSRSITILPSFKITTSSIVSGVEQNAVHMKPDIAGAAHRHVISQRQMNRARAFFIFQNSAVYLCGIVSANAQLRQIAGFRSRQIRQFWQIRGLLALNFTVSLFNRDAHRFAGDHQCRLMSHRPHKRLRFIFRGASDTLRRKANCQIAAIQRHSGRWDAVNPSDRQINIPCRRA